VVWVVWVGVVHCLIHFHFHMWLWFVGVLRCCYTHKTSHRLILPISGTIVNIGMYILNREIPGGNKKIYFKLC